MIGLDFGSQRIKICELDNRHVPAMLVAAGMKELHGTGEAGLLTAVVKTLCNEIPFSTNNTVTSTGGCSVIARNYSFPDISAEELQGAVNLEAEQSISCDMSAMYTDFQVLSRDDPGKVDVLFVAVPRESADRQMKLFQGAGLMVRAIDIDNLALANCYLAFDRDALKQSVVLLNIGHTHTNVAVLDNGKLRFIRNVAFGGRDVSAEIARRYHVAPEIAEEIKKRPEVWQTLGLNIRGVLKKTMPDLLEEIYRSIEYCMSRKKLATVDKILLTGGTSYLAGIDSFVSEVIGIQVEQWNPLTRGRIEVPGKNDEGAFLSVALGLALRREIRV